MRLPWPLVALLIASSVVAWPLLVRRAGRPVAAEPRRRPVGPWGELERYSILVEPRPGLITSDVCDIPRPRWLLPGMSRASLEGTIDGAGLSDGDRRELLAAVECAADGCRVLPPDDVLLSMPPAARSSIYRVLGRFPENGFHFSPFRRKPAELATWFDGDGLAPDTLALFRSLSYPDGDGIAFADLPLLCARTASPDEKVRFLRAAFRSPALVVMLRVAPDSDVDGLVRYWSRGPLRHKDLRVLVGSLASGGGGRIGVGTFLPRGPRARLNTFPERDEPARNCFWTAFHFFDGDKPDGGDEPFTDPESVERHLAARYRAVDPKQLVLGDVLLFRRPDGTPIHAAVHVADDIVYTKNGVVFHAPWVLMTLAELGSVYQLGEMTVYRRTDLDN